MSTPPLFLVNPLSGSFSEARIGVHGPWGPTDRPGVAEHWLLKSSTLSALLMHLENQAAGMGFEDVVLLSDGQPSDRAGRANTYIASLDPAEQRGVYLVLHLHSSPGGLATRPGTLFFKQDSPHSHKLAEQVRKVMKKELPELGRLSAVEGHRESHPHVSEHLGRLAQGYAALLVEPAGIHTDSHAAILSDHAGLERLARALLTGVRQWLKSQE